VWDAEDIPDLELWKGAATGSARPLVWAHAEYIKLCRSIADGNVFDRPPQTVARYLTGAPLPPHFAVWRFNNKIRTMQAGEVLRIETLAAAVVHAGCDGWTRTYDVEAVDTGLGVWIADLDPKALGITHHVDFTFFWLRAAQWEGEDFRVACH
jgi:glucoamylase